MKRLLAGLTLLVLAVLSAPISVGAATDTAGGSVSLTVAPEFQHPCVGYSSVTLVATITGPSVPLELLHRPEGGDWADAGAFSYDELSKTYTISVTEPSAGTYEYAAVAAPGATGDIQPQLVLPWNVPGLTLAEDSASSEVHTQAGLSAALSCVKGGEVAFRVHGPGAATAPGPVAVTGLDVATTYTSDAEGTDTVRASYKICSDVSVGTCSTFRSNAVTHQWTLPTAALTLAGPSTSCVGESVTVSALVQEDESPLSGVVVDFAISGSDGSALSYTATSNSTGTASITYSRSSQTLDSVTATAEIPDASPDPVTADATVTWNACTLIAAIAPEDARAVTGSRLTETVTVVLDGTPAPGAQVELQEAMAGQPTLTLTGTTGSDGSVAFVLSRDFPGVDHLAVTARYAGSVASGTTTALWEPAAPASTPVSSLPPTPSSSTAAPPPAPPPPVTAPPASSAAVGPVPTSRAPAPLPSSSRPRPTHSRAPASPAPHNTRSASGAPKPHRSPARPLPPGSLTVRDASPLPGERDRVTGRGCPPSATVVAAVDGVPVGHTRADAHGGFEVGFVAPARPVGRHRLTATCGRVVLATPLDYVTSASSGGANGALPAAILVGLALMAFVVVPVLRRGFGTGGL